MPPGSKLSPVNEKNAELDGYPLSQGKASLICRDPLRDEKVKRLRHATT